MAKVEKITDHARKTKSEGWYKEWWKCKHCDKSWIVTYQDYANMRSHMRRNHPIQYKPFVIQEEPDDVLMPVL